MCVTANWNWIRLTCNSIGPFHLLQSFIYFCFCTLIVQLMIKTMNHKSQTVRYCQNNVNATGYNDRMRVNLTSIRCKTHYFISTQFWLLPIFDQFFFHSQNSTVSRPCIGIFFITQTTSIGSKQFDLVHIDHLCMLTLHITVHYHG